MLDFSRALPTGCNEEDSECYNINDVPCSGDSHDATCSWHCKNPQPTDEFCQGGMDMLMDGFNTSGDKNGYLKIIMLFSQTFKFFLSLYYFRTKICVILFFKSWRLNSPGKFAAGCIGVFFLGLMIEVIIAVRRKVVSKKRMFINLPIYARKLIVISLFGINLVGPKICI